MNAQRDSSRVGVGVQPLFAKKIARTLQKCETVFICAYCIEQDDFYDPRLIRGHAINP